MTDSCLPVGGSTGLSHEHSAAVEETARFLGSVPSPEHPRPLVPALKAMFNLTSVEAVETIRLSHEVQP